MMSLSILMSCFYKDNPSHLRLALNSLLNQSIMPCEIVLVCDGPLSDPLNLCIDHYEKKFAAAGVSVEIVRLDVNVGLGLALNEGLRVCSSDLIVRMDADDVSVPNRLMELRDFFSKNDNVDVLGAQIEEFLEIPGDLGRYRSVPLDHDEIVRECRFRSPMNHVTVCFRRHALESCGGYENVQYYEDYALWIKLIDQNLVRFCNLPARHVHVRVGGLASRRSGMRFFVAECRFFKYCMDKGFMNFWSGLPFFLPRLAFRLLPGFLASQLFRFLRVGKLGHL